MDSRQNLLFDADAHTVDGSETSSDTIEMTGLEEIPVTPARRSSYGSAQYVSGSHDSDDDSDVSSTVVGVVNDSPAAAVQAEDKDGAKKSEETGPKTEGGHLWSNHRPRDHDCTLVSFYKFATYRKITGACASVVLSAGIGCVVARVYGYPRRSTSSSLFVG